MQIKPLHLSIGVVVALYLLFAFAVRKRIFEPWHVLAIGIAMGFCSVGVLSREVVMNITHTRGFDPRSPLLLQVTWFIIPMVIAISFGTFKLFQAAKRQAAMPGATLEELSPATAPVSTKSASKSSKQGQGKSKKRK